MKIKKCKTLAFVRLPRIKSKFIQFMKTVRPCELKPWKTKIFHVDFKFEVTLTLMTLHKLYLRVNSPILATLLNKD
jgi:hypothetical protein